MDSGEEIVQRIKEQVKRDIDMENIICPYCNHFHREELSEYVTYWGQEESKEFSCNECGKDFMVKKEVTRKFYTSKIGEDDEND